MSRPQLVPTLRSGDVVILDNLSSHKSPGAARALRDIGTWFLFLPPYSPDLNPIEMAFSKLKALIRKAAARTYHELWKAVGHGVRPVQRRGMLQLLQGSRIQNPIKRDTL